MEKIFPIYGMSIKKETFWEDFDFYTFLFFRRRNMGCNCLVDTFSQISGDLN